MDLKSKTDGFKRSGDSFNKYFISKVDGFIKVTSTCALWIFKQLPKVV